MTNSALSTSQCFELLHELYGIPWTSIEIFLILDQCTRWTHRQFFVCITIITLSQYTHKFYADNKLIISVPRVFMRMRNEVIALVTTTRSEIAENRRMLWRKRDAHRSLTIDMQKRNLILMPLLTRVRTIFNGRGGWTNKRSTNFPWRMSRERNDDWKLKVHI